VRVQGGGVRGGGQGRARVDVDQRGLGERGPDVHAEHDAPGAVSAHSAPRSARYSCTNWMAIAPAPTEGATRLVEPCRTSPTAKTPGTLVSRNNGGRASGHEGGAGSWSRSRGSIRSAPVSR